MCFLKRDVKNFEWKNVGKYDKIKSAVREAAVVLLPGQPYRVTSLFVNDLLIGIKYFFKIMSSTRLTILANRINET